VRKNDSTSSSVLVIEDDPEMRGLLVLMLQEEGYHLFTASDGREGLEVLRTAKPDLILLDMKMPVMDGYEFARQYRDAYRDRAPIVVMTAAEDPRKRAEEIGAAGWLGKPVELEELFSTVKQFSAHPQP
jgi:CheY-like chemotaxis protein